jgi:hypothetical protein
MTDIRHPDFPLLPGCWLSCMGSFGLRPDTGDALWYELGSEFTVGKLMERYAADFTAIPGIGRSRAANLNAVLAAAGYPSPLDIAVHVPYTLEQDEDGVRCARASLRLRMGIGGEGETASAAAEHLRQALHAMIAECGALRLRLTLILDLT